MAAVSGEPGPPRDAYSHDEAMRRDEEATESTPLIARSDDGPAPTDQSQPQRERSAESLLRTLSDGKARRRWPSVLALLILCLVAILIMVFAFFAPSVVEQYAAQAVVFEPTSLSIAAFTASGVRARIQGEFNMDASRVQRKPIRDLGIFGTWIAREAESGETDITVSLPEYGNVVLGVAHVPGIKVDLRNGHRTHVDFLSDLQPGDTDGIRRLANDWIDGRLGQLRVVGKATVPLKSGIFSLGSQTVRHELTFANEDVPSIPAYDIEQLLFKEVDVGDGQGIRADVSLSVANDYPFDFTIPPLGFKILVDGCFKDDPYIQVARALTDHIHVQPKQEAELNVTGFVRELPKPLTQSCPGTEKSPLDNLLGRYMHGDDTTIYVRGSETPDENTPAWIEELISDITVPVTVPGRSFGHLIKNFSLEDTHFSLPDPFAEPDTPEANPQISAVVRALIALPEEMKFGVEAHRVRADADVFYKGSKLGKLDLSQWQRANSTRLDDDGDDGPMLLVESRVEDAPLYITDSDLFTDVMQDLLFGRKSVLMHIVAEVDVEVETALGEFKIRRIPAEGEVPVKPISTHLPDHDGNPGSILHPALADLHILDTTASSITLEAALNLTNPTPYSATVPYVDIQLLKNGSLLGHATARNLEIRPGPNTNLRVQAVYEPLEAGGPPARAIGTELLSQFLSGWNASLTLRAHEGTFPSQPRLGAALSRFEFDIPLPSLKAPSPPPDDGDHPHDPDDGGNPDKPSPRFIRDATFHLLSSTATFTLFSPLRYSTLIIERINATALYPHPLDPNDPDGDETEDSPVGHILYERSFAVPPVDASGHGTPTPRLPVEWSLGGVGQDAVRRALGGTLRLAAFARVRVRIGNWREEVWFRSRGIGAKVRL